MLCSNNSSENNLLFRFRISAYLTSYHLGGVCSWIVWFDNFSQTPLRWSSESSEGQSGIIKIWERKHVSLRLVCRSLLSYLERFVTVDVVPFVNIIAPSCTLLFSFLLIPLSLCPLFVQLFVVTFGSRGHYSTLRYHCHQ